MEFVNRDVKAMLVDSRAFRITEQLVPVDGPNPNGCLMERKLTFVAVGGGWLYFRRRFPDVVCRGAQQLLNYMATWDRSAVEAIKITARMDPKQGMLSPQNKMLGQRW